MEVYYFVGSTFFAGMVLVFKLINSWAELKKRVQDLERYQDLVSRALTELYDKGLLDD